MFWHLAQTMLTPSITHLAQNAPKLWAKAVLVLEAREVRDDFQTDQVLVILIAALAMRVGAHQAKRASEHRFYAADIEFVVVAGGLAGAHHVLSDFLFG
jgi:hypothetical protein